MEMTTMNGRSKLCYSVVDPGEATSTGFEDFLELFGARHSSSGDLFDLVRQGGARGGRSMEVQPSLRLSSSSSSVTLLPSEDEVMAAWLYPIVSGQEPAVVVAGHCNQPSDGVVARDAEVDEEDDDPPADHKREKPPNMEDKCCSGAKDSTERYSCGSRKKATRGAKRSHPAETHNLTEKRRRLKINEKLKTLQRLVPGCKDESSQASTLDQTILHIKSLQQQIQIQQSLAHTALINYPVVVPPPCLPPGTAVTAAGRTPPPPVALAPEVLRMVARGHVRPGVVLAPPLSSCCCDRALHPAADAANACFRRAGQQVPRELGRTIQFQAESYMVERYS